MKEQIRLLRDYEDQMRAIQDAIDAEWWYSEKDKEKYSKLEQMTKDHYDKQLSIAMESYKKQEKEYQEHLERLESVQKAFAKVDEIIYESTQKSKIIKSY